MREKIEWFLENESVFCCENSKSLIDYIKYRDTEISLLMDSIESLSGSIQHSGAEDLINHIILKLQSLL